MGKARRSVVNRPDHGQDLLMGWYLARDGKQYGPLTDLEMRKFVELGHLRPTDLVWRQGFADWRPASVVFPQRPSPRPPPAGAARPRGAPREQPVGDPQGQHRAVANQSPAAKRELVAPGPGPETTDAEEHASDDVDGPTPRRKRWRFLVALAALAIPAAVAWYLLKNPDLISRINVLQEAKTELPIETLQTAPFRPVGAEAEQVDEAFQRAALWQIIKREFPQWYADRVKEAVQLNAERRDEDTITRHFAEAVVALRRQHADQALAASPAALRAVAANFLDSLKHLAENSVEACYGFISQGETSPHVLKLLGEPGHVLPLQRQFASVFAAVAEGRKSPQTHLPPRKTDYDALTQALTSRGWTDRELQLFSDPRALARATPDQVCRLVQDWFAAQLSIKDQDVQLRLLVESLKPVVTG
jgi:hypothetical protein